MSTQMPQSQVHTDFKYKNSWKDNSTVSQKYSSDLFENHRRRIKTEEKAKVVASIYSVPCLGRFWRIWRIHPFLSNHHGVYHPLIKIVQCKTASVARNWINSSPQTEATTFAFSSVFTLLLCLPPTLVPAAQRHQYASPAVWATGNRSLDKNNLIINRIK